MRKRHAQNKKQHGPNAGNKNCHFLFVIYVIDFESNAEINCFAANGMIVLHKKNVIIIHIFLFAWLKMLKFILF